jgi:amino acid transporter
MAVIMEKEKLKREIGVLTLSLAIINMTIGTGIFIIPAIISENLGAAAIVAYIVCGVLMFLIALCFAEVGSKVTSNGGTYTYIETAFGPFPGFIANNLFWFGTAMLSDAAVANGLADTLKYFSPLFGVELYRTLFFVFIFGILALINIRSTKNSMKFIELTTFVKLIPLILLIVIGTSFISSENLVWTITPTVGNIGNASLLLIFAFFGVEYPMANSGEIKNAKRTIPLSIFFGISAVLIIYISIQVVTQGVLGNTLVSHKDAPLGAVAEIIAGKSGIIIMIIAIAISMFGNLGGSIFSTPRVLYAGAQDSLMPKVFEKVHAKYFTPYIAILFYTVLGLLFASIGGFKQLAIISGASTLLIYLGVILSTIKLRKRNSPTLEKTFQIPGGIIIPLLAVGVILWLLSNLSRLEIISLMIFIAVFTLIYFSTKLVRKNP